MKRSAQQHGPGRSERIAAQTTRIVASTLACLGLAACEFGSSSKKLVSRYGEAVPSTAPAGGASVYETERALPRCDSAQHRRLVYVISEAQFRYCVRDKWEAATSIDPDAISLAARKITPDKGPEGPQGPEGPIGPQGPQGPSGDRGPAGSAGPAGAPAVVKTSAEPPGANCTAGGQKLESGVDDGRSGGIANNGQLESGEVLNTAFTCNAVSSGLRVYKSADNPLGTLISFVTFPYTGPSQTANALASGLYVRSLSDDKFTIYQVANSLALPGGDAVSESNQQLGLVTGNMIGCAVPLFVNNNCSGQAYMNPCTSQQATSINSTLMHFSFNAKFFYRFENTGLDYAFTSNLMESVLVSSYLSPAGACRAMTLTTQARRIKIEPNVFADYINPPGTMQTSWFIAP